MVPDEGGKREALGRGEEYMISGGLFGQTVRLQSFLHPSMRTNTCIFAATTFKLAEKWKQEEYRAKFT